MRLLGQCPGNFSTFLNYIFLIFSQGFLRNAFCWFHAFYYGKHYFLVFFFVFVCVDYSSVLTVFFKTNDFLLIFFDFFSIWIFFSWFSLNPKISNRRFIPQSLFTVHIMKKKLTTEVVSEIQNVRQMKNVEQVGFLQ